MATLTKWDRRNGCPGDSITTSNSEVKEVIPRTNTLANGTFQKGAKVILNNKQEIPVVETVEEVNKALGSSSTPQRTASPGLITS